MLRALGCRARGADTEALRALLCTAPISSSGQRGRRCSSGAPCRDAKGPKRSPAAPQRPLCSHPRGSHGALPCTKATCRQLSSGAARWIKGSAVPNAARAALGPFFCSSRAVPSPSSPQFYDSMILAILL